MNTRMERPARFTRAFRETEAIIPIPVEERTSEMRNIYTKRGEKLILGQKNDGSRPSTAPKSRPNTAAAAGRAKTPVGKGVSQPGTRPKRAPSSGLTFQDSIDASMSMLSIGLILDDFHSLMSNERSNATQALDPANPDASLFDSAATAGAPRPLSPLRRAITPSAWLQPKLFCRYPQCKQEFKSAFDLYAHTRKAHTDSRNFARTVVPPRSSTSYRLVADGEIDPRKRASPHRPNCSGLLAEVPKTRVPSPDKHGMMWPVEVLHAQKKFNEEHELAAFRAHR